MNDSKENERFTHPSFGQISFSRATFGGKHPNTNFYGSELPQDHCIIMSVHKSEIDRSLAQDRYYTREVPLIEVRMTSNQFSELITSLNIGSGVPCTIEWLNQKQVEQVTPPESRKEFVHRKFQDRMTEFAKSIREQQLKARDLVKKKTLSKQDVHDLTHHIEWLTNEVELNIPFFMKCFQETMDEVVIEAKQEVENAIQHKINVLGLAELHKQNKLIGE